MTWNIVAAGAGSGKTYRIKTELVDWVAAGEVRPERILAVSFTDAAAAELKGRIRGALLDADRLDDAAALERAYISTIHSLGSRVLTENAFAAGVSPGLRLIEEAEAELLRRRALAETTALDAVLRKLMAFAATPAGTGTSPGEPSQSRRRTRAARRASGVNV